MRDWREDSLALTVGQKKKFGIGIGVAKGMLVVRDCFEGRS